MSNRPNEVVKPSGLRLASQYKPVERQALVRDQYPATLPFRSTQDLVYCQAILNNGNNFAERTNCDVFELGADGIGHMRTDLGDKELCACIRASSLAANSTRIFFLTSQRSIDTTFASQVSLSQALALELLQSFAVTPHFVPSLLSEPDYAAPGTYNSYDSQGQLSKQEFICQHPRWDIHVKMQPCSVYMSYQKENSNTVYIVASGVQDTCVEVAKERLRDVCVPSKSEAPDPFFLHNIIAQESFLQSKPVITKLRFRLYDQLDKVDSYGNGTLALDRADLKALTNELHGVSQDADSLVSSAEMGSMIAERMYSAHDILKTTSECSLQQGYHQIDDSLGHLVESLQARRRWILSYKSRKDTAMNMVFNLVIQQDSETNMAIAQATKNDSAAMKTIAALTMIFLPATAVSSFFGMAFFNTQNGNLTVTRDWWLFLATTLPITVVLFLIWVMWPDIVGAGKTLAKVDVRSIVKLLARPAQTPEPDKIGSVSRRPSSLKMLLSRSSAWWSDEKDPTQMV